MKSQNPNKVVNKIFTIGRSKKCHFIIADPTISRTHATLTVQHDDTLVLADNNTENGTFLLQKDGTKEKVISSAVTEDSTAVFGTVEVPIKKIVEKISEYILKNDELANVGEIANVVVNNNESENSQVSYLNEEVESEIESSDRIIDSKLEVPNSSEVEKLEQEEPISANIQEEGFFPQSNQSEILESQSSLLSLIGRWIAVLGSIVLVSGLFAPIVKIPILGELSIFTMRGEPSIAPTMYVVIGIVLATVLLTIFRLSVLVVLIGLGSIVYLGYYYSTFTDSISEIGANLNNGNLLEVLVGGAINTAWGWSVLFMGAAIIIIGGLLMTIDNSQKQ